MIFIFPLTFHWEDKVHKSSSDLLFQAVCRFRKEILTDNEFFVLCYVIAFAWSPHESFIFFVRIFQSLHVLLPLTNTSDFVQNSVQYLQKILMTKYHPAQLTIQRWATHYCYNPFVIQQSAEDTQEVAYNVPVLLVCMLGANRRQEDTTCFTVNTVCKQRPLPVRYACLKCDRVEFLKL